jgi:dihydroorotase (multifunctional complex type)
MLQGSLVRADVLIDEGVIAGVLGPDEAADAVVTIDATGRWVLPGAIDTHSHTRDPGYTQKEDFETASMAAAVGGFTTIVDMPNVEPPTDSLETFLAKREDAARRMHVDWGHWVAPTRPDEIPGLVDAGVTGFKIFQVSGSYPHDPRLAMNDEGDLLRTFRIVADTGLPMLVHPFNQRLFERLSQEAFEAGKPPDWRTFAWIYTIDSIWSTAVHALLNLQALSGVRLHLLHTHAAGSYPLIRAAKEQGRPVSCEVDPKYYLLTDDDLERLGPRACPGGPIAADPVRMAAIWRALNDGTIDNIGSDHAPHTLEEIAKQDTDAWTAAMGSPQYDWELSLILSDVLAGRLALGRAVTLFSEAPAKLVGVWPRKGAIVPGADADLILVDPAREHRITDEGLYTKCGWTPYVGRTVQAVVTHTFLRGSLIAREREILGVPGQGRYIPGSPLA